MDSYIQTYGQYETVVDGNIIDNAKWNMIYDGDILDLEAQKNDESLYVQLTNEEIMKLFQIPASHHTISDRLEQDLHQSINVQPIIMEEIAIEPKIHHKKHKSRRKSKSKSKPKQSKSKSRIKRDKLTPDYLKTIY